MASLKKIINTDDDHVDPSFAITPNSTTTRQPLRPDSSASTYPPTRDHPASAASHNNLLDPSRFYSAEPSSSTGVLPGRRPSNTSIDSMESPYGPGPSVPSSSSAMRPFAPAMASSDLPKLTPITGKISKAKKGQPVHTCDKCPKTFTRAEHLRRHQLSHAPPELHCNVPNCGKTFYRKDLLERHLQRHEQDDEKSPKASHHSKRRGSRSSHQSYGSTHQEAGLQMPAAFAGGHPINQRNDLPSGPSMSGTWQPMGTGPGGSQSHGPQVDAHDEYSISGVTNHYVLGPGELSNLQPTPDPFVQDYQPRSHQELAGLYISSSTPPAPNWQDNATMPSSASESNYSTPSDHSRRHRLPARASSGEWTDLPAYATAAPETRSPVMQDAGFQFPISYSVSPPQAYTSAFGGSMGLPLAGFDENPPFLDPDQNPATTVRSLSPQLAVAQSSETLVTIPSVPATDHAYGGAMCGGPPAAGLGFLGSRNTFGSLSRPARDAIPKYLNVYWDKVHPLYPIVHKSSLEATSGGLPEEVDVLQCAMAAVATQFLDEKEHRNLGAQLHNYAWYKSKVFTTADSWPLPVQQTLLLCEYYSRFRGRKKESYKPSQRYNLLYHGVFNNQNAFIPIPTERNTMDQWMDWIDMETRRRLLAACFLLDVHSARYHEQRYTRPNGLDYSYPGGLPIPLSGSTDQLWDASTPQEWSTLQKTNNLLTLSDFDLESLTAEDISNMSPFDSAIMLAACALDLPCRQDLTQVDSTQKAPDFQIDALPIAKLFPDSAVANTYLALHHTPLHFLLSVSGDSWIFNKKVIEASSFAEHKRSLNEWRKSPSAAVATVFAAKALEAFFSLDATLSTSDEGAVPVELSSGWRDISDYWGVYVCALICWAFGRSGRKVKKTGAPSRETVMRWIVTVAGMEPNEVESMPDKHIAHGVVGLVQAELAADCLGGQNILFADAVGVLKTLEQSDNRGYE